PRELEANGAEDGMRGAPRERPRICVVARPEIGVAGLDAHPGGDANRGVGLRAEGARFSDIAIAIARDARRTFSGGEVDVDELRDPIAERRRTNGPLF